MEEGKEQAKSGDTDSPAEESPEEVPTQAACGKKNSRDEVDRDRREFLHGFLEETVGVGVGDRIGNYKIIEKIGEGGFGIVFLAEQRKPIRRKVALKVIKPGMDTREVIARFEAERQALALMDHPGIAKVLDAGATDEGRPYFVMEWVKGVPITHYCDENQLSIRERLNIFISVCSAVQHAHLKGVIHRDLKPPNVLVAMQDGEPGVKVIDFGIAKAISQELTEKTLFTARGLMIGTPQYMSPEQSGTNDLDIDSRSDVYSLGVLLYELLVGVTPLDLKKIREVALEEVHRLIQEVEPQKPSTKLVELVREADEDVTTASRESPERRSRQLQGDLDWIVMKALEKDRMRRYETPNGLADDIERYLKNAPVVASPPSPAYLLKKFAARHKGIIVTCTSVFLALIGATSFSLYQAKVAKDAQAAEKRQREKLEEALEETRAAKAAEAEQRALAEEKELSATKAKEIAQEKGEEAARRALEAERVLSFFEDYVIAAARPQGLDGGLGINTTVREALASAETKIDESFEGQEETVATIRNALGHTYRYLGDPAEAVKQFRVALEIRRNPEGGNQPAIMNTMGGLALALHDAGEYQEALELAEKVFDYSSETYGEMASESLDAMDLLGNIRFALDDWEGALEIRERVLEIRRTKNKTEPLVRSMENLAASYRDLGMKNKASNLLLEAKARVDTSFGAGDLRRLNIMSSVALSSLSAGKFEEARQIFETVWDAKKQYYGEQHPETLRAGFRLADFFLKAGEAHQSVVLNREILEHRKEILGGGHPATFASVVALEKALNAAGLNDEALELKREREYWVQRNFGDSGDLAMKAFITPPPVKTPETVPEHNRPPGGAVGPPPKGPVIKSTSNEVHLEWGTEKSGPKLAGGGPPASNSQNATGNPGGVGVSGDSPEPFNWQYYFARCFYGASLAESGDPQAIAVLLPALRKLRETAPESERASVRLGLQWIINYYTEVGDASNTVKWRRELEEFDSVR